METIWNNLKFALRQLRRSPGFAITAVLTLALGIGANTAIFSLLDQALLRALPVRDPASLVVFEDSSTFWRGSISMSGGDQKQYFSYPEYLGLRDQARDFSNLLATTSYQVGFTRNNVAQFVQVEIVSGNYFQTLGVQPALGRTLQPFDDTIPGANPVAVLSYDFWRGHLGADPAIVGQTVSMNGHPFQIVGVSAPRFTSAVWGRTTGIFLPMSMLQQAIPPSADTRSSLLDHQYKWLSILGRLKPGVTAAQAQAETAPLWHAMRVSDLALLGNTTDRFSAGFLRSQLLVRPGARGFSFNRDTLEKPFLAVMAMAALVLIIASVNVASLLMVRSAGRRREFSLRAALGASSSRIFSQLLLEGVLLGLFGGMVGLLLAPLALRVLIARLADQDGQTAFLSSIDTRILFFNFAVAVCVSLCFSLLPALQMRRPNLTSTLRESTGTGAGGLLKIRRIIVCLQIGLSVVLLVAAGLFIRTLEQLRAVDVGFNTTHLLTFNINPLFAGYTSAQTPIVQQRILDGLSTLPGIQSVAASDNQELAGNGNFYSIGLSGYQAPPDELYQAQNSTVTANYLTAMHIPLLAGRDLSDTDTVDHPSVALVDETFVKHFCNGSNFSCLGRFIDYGPANPNRSRFEIVGVFRDYHTKGIRQEPPAIMLRSLKQSPDAAQLYLYLRTTLAPEQAEDTVRAAMRRIDPTLPVGTMVSMDQQIDANLQNERMITLLAIAFGVLATVLAGVGIYGVLAYSIAQRTREIGIRMALGSTRLAVSSLILKDVLSLAALGVVIAVPTAYGLSILIRSQLYGVSAADPGILTSAVGLIALVALLSALIPAQRAASVSPTEALRTE